MEISSKGSGQNALLKTTLCGQSRRLLRVTKQWWTSCPSNVFQGPRSHTCCCCSGELQGVLPPPVLSTPLASTRTTNSCLCADTTFLFLLWEECHPNLFSLCSKGGGVEAPRVNKGRQNLTVQVEGRRCLSGRWGYVCGCCVRVEGISYVLGGGQRSQKHRWCISKGARLLGTVSWCQIARQWTVNNKSKVRVVTTFQSFLQLKTWSLYSLIQFAFAVSRKRTIKVILSLFLEQHK